MKFLIASDLHGDLNAAKALRAAFEGEGADRLVLLGDLLYHGPRNDLPSAYDPKGVIALLNRLADKILAVRGNCDTEVDQMVLPFPILAEYALLMAGDRTVFATHGHNYNLQNLPPLKTGDILLHGHTHVLRCEEFGSSNTYLNPGSVSLPKDGNPKTYMLYSDRTFSIKDLSGNTVLKKVF